MGAKIIAMGETVLDILFHERQTKDGNECVPFAAVPGGSSFNSMVSVGRSGVPCLFIGYTGNNRVGHQIVDFMKCNGISTDYFEVREGERAALSLAYLDENGDADYVFYKDTPVASSNYQKPKFTSKDYFLYGSYFAICPGLRAQVSDVLHSVHDSGAVVYYDINFRRSHQHEKAELMPTIQENCQLSSIVRGSADDFEILFGTRNPEEVYHKYIASFCPVFICTAGAGHIFICTPSGTHDFLVPQIPSEEIVSTVGAGDSFNAGFLCAMRAKGIRKEMLSTMERNQWEELVAKGIEYASSVCRSSENYISR